MSSTANVDSLFGNAQAAGALTPAANQVVGMIPDMGAQIQAGLGVTPDDVSASEVTLVTILIDDSGSMERNHDVACNGHNQVIDALLKTKQKDGILICCRSLNSGVIYPYTAIDKAPRLSRANYDPNGGTPLYDQTAVTLATVVAKAQEFADAGVPCRTVTLIVTDGAEMGSVKIRSPKKLAPLVETLLRAEMHIIAAMGIDDGSTNFRQVFSDMGIPTNWILTPQNNPSDIRKAFAFASQSAVRASQAAGGAGFSQVAAGGFGAP